jgi:hypothetical protein
LRNRLVALCEVPDLELLPARYPGLRKVIFRGGTELPILNRGVALIAWLASGGVLHAPRALAAFAGAAAGLLHRFGTASSGMVLELRGKRAGTFAARRWSVVAEQGDGLWIPALAAALLTDRLDRGERASGARPGIDVLTLADFRAGFSGLAIQDAIVDLPVPVSPFRQWLGAAVDSLPPAIRRLHDDPLERSAIGTVTVIRGTHPIAAAICRWLGFPQSAEAIPLQVEFEPKDGEETWRRRFAGSVFVSRLRPWPGRTGYVRETVGALTYGFRLVAGPEGLRMEFQRWWFRGIPLPRALGPRVEALQWQEGKTYCFSVDVAAPGLGRVIAYRGRLGPPQ